MKVLRSAAILAALWSTASLAEVPRVVATIKPIHAIVAAVMGDRGTPELVVRGGASPHTYSLRPSDASALQRADVVFWAGRGLELFLERSLDTLAASAVVVELATAPGVELLPIRQGGAFEAHADEDIAHGDEPEHGQAETAEASHGSLEETDMHFWLDPLNAARMLEHIAVTLATADPDNASVYTANAKAEVARYEALVNELDARLQPVRGRPFMVFHDAYQYFERRFGVAAAGAITVTPDTMPGAARISEIRARLSDTVACVFTEPQFQPAIVTTIVEGTGVRIGTPDPLGSDLPEGRDLYPDLIGGFADALLDCLAAD